LSQQKTECQTKYLLANTTSTGVLSDLTFNDLDITKKYKVNGLFRFIESTTTNNNKDYQVGMYDGGALLRDVYSAATSVTTYRQTKELNHLFKPVNTSITFNLLSVTNGNLLGGGNTLNTHVELCELPDTYVDTTEF
jgi:hypothetical protein